MTSTANVAQEIADFAGRMTPAQARWEYALSRGSYRHISPDGEAHLRFILPAMRSLSRFLGYHTPSLLAPHLLTVSAYGFEGAIKRSKERVAYWRSHDPYPVGPIEPWQIGHVYFARLVSHPHIAKVGFSRRVRERRDEIESRAQGRVTIAALKVGTLADEHWWHNDWRNLRIKGEWFFWPKSADRSLPQFLVEEREAA